MNNQSLTQPRPGNRPSGRGRVTLSLVGVSAAAALFASMIGDVGASARTHTSPPSPGTNAHCVPAPNHPGAGHFRFATSTCDNAATTILTLRLYRGVSNGKTVWYTITDSSSMADATARGVNFAPKLANAANSAGVEKVTVVGGVVYFPATVNFAHHRVLVPSKTGFPPLQAAPPAVGDPGYSPLIQLPDGTVEDAPQVANSTGQGAKVVKLDTHHRKLEYTETEGFYEGKHVHYASFDASIAVAAAIENVTYAPALQNVPSVGSEDMNKSARETLAAFINGPTGVDNPFRQGINSAILDHMDPHNILHEAPVLVDHADVGSTMYTPMWDVHLIAWTQTAIDAGDRIELRSIDDDVEGEVSAGLVTGPGGAAIQGGDGFISSAASGFLVNCPLMAIDVP
jgi:hypothetical protein